MKQRFDNTLPYLIVTLIFYYSLPFICYALNSPFYNLTPFAWTSSAYLGRVIFSSSG